MLTRQHLNYMLRYIDRAWLKKLISKPQVNYFSLYLALFVIFGPMMSITIQIKRVKLCFLGGIKYPKQLVPSCGLQQKVKQWSRLFTTHSRKAVSPKRVRHPKMSKAGTPATGKMTKKKKKVYRYRPRFIQKQKIISQSIIFHLFCKHIFQNSFQILYSPYLAYL